MTHNHHTLIKALGGTTALGRVFGFTPQRVDRWRSQGIPVKYWPTINKLCIERGLRVPKDIKGFFT